MAAATASIICFAFFGCERPQAASQASLQIVESEAKNISLEEEGRLYGSGGHWNYAVWTDRKTGARFLKADGHPPVVIPDKPEPLEGH